MWEYLKIAFGNTRKSNELFLGLYFHPNLYSPNAMLLSYRLWTHTLLAKQPIPSLKCWGCVEPEPGSDSSCHAKPSLNLAQTLYLKPSQARAKLMSEIFYRAKLSLFSLTKTYWGLSSLGFKKKLFQCILDCKRKFWNFSLKTQTKLLAIFVVLF